MTDTISIRQAMQGDAVALMPLFMAFFHEEGIPVDPAQMVANLNRMIASEASKVLIALDRTGTAVGFVTATITHGVEFGACAEIEDLFVTPTWRGQGLSRRLMQDITAFCRDQGARMATVVVTGDGMQQNLGVFYERLGFRISDRTVFYLELEDSPP